MIVVVKIKRRMVFGERVTIDLRVLLPVMLLPLLLSVLNLGLLPISILTASL
jgi:hypothetical protein